jgi:hypothetical protein
MRKKENQMNKELIAQLENLNQRDIETRNRLLEEGRLYGKYDEEMQNVHRENALALHEIISIHGWPGISVVGLEGSRAAWLIAQHAICTPSIQRKFFEYISKAAASGDVPQKQVALLTDRIRYSEGKPQIYGTVLDWNENGELTCELENPEMVDELREQVGLPPFQQSLQEHRAEIEAEGGKPPKNYKAYKQAGYDWARSVGWR